MKKRQKEDASVERKEVQKIVRYVKKGKRRKMPNNVCKIRGKEITGRTKMKNERFQNHKKRENKYVIGIVNWNKNKKWKTQIERE